MVFGVCGSQAAVLATLTCYQRGLLCFYLRLKLPDLGFVRADIVHFQVTRVD